MMLNIKLIKMINGEEIIAKVKDEDATHITVTKPAIVMMAPGQNGNMSELLFLLIEFRFLYFLLDLDL